MPSKRIPSRTTESIRHQVHPRKSANALPSRWHLVIQNLIYPAFLGNLIYVTFEKVIDPRFKVTEFLAGLFLVLLFAIYILDYAYTVVNERRLQYTMIEFTLDSIQVFCLYVAINSALYLAFGGKAVSDSVNGEWLSHPAAWLAGGKFVALLWEFQKFRIENREDEKKIRLYALITDAGLVAIYGCTATYTSTGELRLLILPAGLEILSYLGHEIARKYFIK